MRNFSGKLLSGKALLERNMIANPEAFEYHLRGYNILALPERSKKPTDGDNWKKWISVPQSDQDIKSMFHGEVGNLAVIGGVRSAGSTAGFPYFLDVDDLGAFIEIKAEIARIAGETWISRSLRGGAVWCMSTFPVKSRRLLLDGRSVGEIRGVGNYIVAPPSIHPSNIPYVFEHKSEHIALIDSLSFTPLEFGYGTDYSSLPRVVKRILSDDGQFARTTYASRSECDFAIIVALTNKSADTHLIQRILELSPYSHYRSLRTGDRVGWLNRASAKAQRQGDSAHYVAAVKTAQTYRRWALTTAPALITDIRTGVTDKNALLAHLDVAVQSGRLQYHLSARDGAERASMHRETFTRATSRLLLAGRIKKLQASIMALASRYELGSLPTTPTPPNVCEWPVEEQMSLPTTHGVFERAGLGRQVGDTWQGLLGNWKCIDEVVKSSGKSLKTARRHLGILLRFGLVVQKDGRWTASTEGLEKLGQSLGTHDLAAKRRAVHLRERHRFRALLKAHDSRSQE